MDRKSKYHVSESNEPGFNKFLGWCSVILATVMTAALCWGCSTLIEVQKAVAVLIARPEGVSKSEYDRDANRWDQEITELKRREGEHGH